MYLKEVRFVQILPIVMQNAVMIAQYYEFGIFSRWNDHAKM